MTSPRPEATDTTPVSRAINVLSVGVTLAIAAGLIHTLELSVARHLQHQLVWFSRDFVWMAPMSYGLVLLPVTLLFAIAAAVSSRQIHHVAVFVLALISFFGVLLPYSQIARIASLLFAAGIALQLARAARGAPARWNQRFRRVALGGGVLIALVSFVLPRLRNRNARRAIDALPAVAAETSSPANVLLIILDTVRAASMSLYGAPDSTTPRLQEWASQSSVFDAAYSVGPWTLPSHASLFTGRYAGETTADWTSPLDESDSTLAEIFRVRGYATGGFMANMHYTAWDTGLDRGFITYRDYRRTFWQLVRSSAWTQTNLFGQIVNATSFGDVASAFLHPDLSIDIKHAFDRKYGVDVTAQFLEWQAILQQRPFFAVLNYFDAHAPYFAPDEFLHFPTPVSGTARYSAALAYLDHNIDTILKELRRRNALDNTVVIVTSDHGELFEEHGLSGHAHNLYRNVLHVPLVLRYPPSVPAGRRVSTTVSLRDLPATILDLTALAHATVPGTSLRATWMDTGAAISPALSEVSKASNVDPTYPTAKGPMKGLFDDSTHYIRNGDGREELFRHLDDTLELANLTASSPTVAAPWRTRIDSLLSSRRRP